MVKDRYVGVAYREESWLAVSFTEAGYEEATVFDGIGDCWAAYEEDARLLLVDIPIGLVESGDPSRRCDALARELLGPRSGTVFDPPVREAARKRRYSTADRVHERKAGEALSEAAFERSDAIAMCDELLQEVPEAAVVIRSAHPELCFRAFANEPLEHDATTAAGYAERMRTLARQDRDAPPVVQKVAEATTGHDVSVAAVLDAVVLAYTAAPGGGELQTLPAEVPIDASGLPIELVYRATAPLSK